MLAALEIGDSIISIMRFAVGQRVRHKDTKEIGQVTAVLTDNSVAVCFDECVVKVERHVSVHIEKLELQERPPALDG